MTFVIISLFVGFIAVTGTYAYIRANYHMAKKGRG